MLSLLAATLLSLISAQEPPKPCEMIKVHRHRPRVCSQGHCDKCKTKACQRCVRAKPAAQPAAQPKPAAK